MAKDKQPPEAHYVHFASPEHNTKPTSADRYSNLAGLSGAPAATIKSDETGQTINMTYRRTNASGFTYKQDVSLERTISPEGDGDRMAIFTRAYGDNDAFIPYAQPYVHIDENGVVTTPSGKNFAPETAIKIKNTIRGWIDSGIAFGPQQAEQLTQITLTASQTVSDERHKNGLGVTFSHPDSGELTPHAVTMPRPESPESRTDDAHIVSPEGLQSGVSTSSGKDPITPAILEQAREALAKPPVPNATPSGVPNPKAAAAAVAPPDQTPKR